MRFRYFGTKELRSVTIFTRQTGLSRVDHLRVCPVLAMKAYVDCTSTRQYIHSDPVHPFQHAFMSQVPNKATRLRFPVGPQTCSRWLRTIMNRANIDPNTKVVLFEWLQLRQPLTVEYRSMLCSTQADGLVGRCLRSSTTELAFEQVPEHWPNFVSVARISTLT